MDQPFRANPGATIRITTAGTVAKLPGFPEGGGCTARVFNRGTVAIYVEFGQAGVTASPPGAVAGSLEVPAGTVEFVALDDRQRFVAVAIDSGSPSVEITTGSGGVGGFASGGGSAANPYPGSDYARDGADPAAPAVANGGTGIRGWLATIAGLLKLGTQTKAQSGSVTIATDQGNLEPGGTSITGAAMPAGGTGLTGWLSAIWSGTMTRVTGFADQTNAAIAANGQLAGGGRSVGAPAQYTRYNVYAISNQAGTLFIQGSNDGFATTSFTVSTTALTAGNPVIVTLPAIFSSYRSLINNGGTAATATISSTMTAN